MSAGACDFVVTNFDFSGLGLMEGSLWSPPPITRLVDSFACAVVLHRYYPCNCIPNQLYVLGGMLMILLL